MLFCVLVGFCKFHIRPNVTKPLFTTALVGRIWPLCVSVCVFLYSLRRSYLSDLHSAPHCHPLHQGLQVWWTTCREFCVCYCIHYCLHATILLFSFSVVHFLVVVSMLYIKPTRVGFRAHVKISSCIVSYHDVMWSVPLCVGHTGGCAKLDELIVSQFGVQACVGHVLHGGPDPP